MKEQVDAIVYKGRVITPALLELLDFISEHSPMQPPVRLLLDLNYLQIKLLEMTNREGGDFIPSDQIVASLYMFTEMINLMDQAYLQGAFREIQEGGQGN